jgi:hypothetical protein
MKAKELKTGLWKKSQKEGKAQLQYDQVLDTLFVSFVQEETDRVVAHFVDDCVAFLYRASDKEIIGMQIEYFATMFLSADTPETRREWNLSDTGEELDGFKDLKFVVVAKVEKPVPPMRMIIPPPINKSVELDLVPA